MFRMYGSITEWRRMMSHSSCAFRESVAAYLRRSSLCAFQSKGLGWATVRRRSHAAPKTTARITILTRSPTATRPIYTVRGRETSGSRLCQPECTRLGGTHADRPPPQQLPLAAHPVAPRGARHALRDREVP